MMIKSYTNYIKEELNFRKIFKRKSSINLNDNSFRNDPFNEEVWDDNNTFILLNLGAIYKKKMLQLVDVRLLKIHSNNKYTCEFIFLNNDSYFYSNLIIVLINKKWTFASVYENGNTPCIFCDIDEANKFIDYLNKNYKDLMEKINKKGEFNVNSIFKKIIFG
jgi:hypothetical protein